MTQPSRRAELLAGSADRQQFGVGGRVLGQMDFIHRVNQHFAVVRQHRAKRSATLGDVGLGKVDRALQVLVIVGHGNPSGHDWRVKYGEPSGYSEIKYNHANQWQMEW